MAELNRAFQNGAWANRACANYRAYATESLIGLSCDQSERDQNEHDQSYAPEQNVAEQSVAKQV